MPFYQKQNFSPKEINSTWNKIDFYSHGVENYTMGIIFLSIFCLIINKWIAGNCAFYGCVHKFL